MQNFLSFLWLHFWFKWSSNNSTVAINCVTLFISFDRERKLLQFHYVRKHQFYEGLLNHICTEQNWLQVALLLFLPLVLTNNLIFIIHVMKTYCRSPKSYWCFRTGFYYHRFDSYTLKLVGQNHMQLVSIHAFQAIRELENLSKPKPVYVILVHFTFKANASIWPGLSEKWWSNFNLIVHNHRLAI